MAYYVHATSTGCRTAGAVFPAGKMSLYSCKWYPAPDGRRTRQKVFAFNSGIKSDNLFVV
jgi:hypothetical protein